MKTDNRSNGGRFEQELSHALAEAGFWAHVMQQNKSGQPADIIAVKGKYHTLIDCKVISDNGGFRLERVEDNQRLAMDRFLTRAHELCWFAMRLPDGDVWMVAQSKTDYFRNSGIPRMSEADIKAHGWQLEKWLKATDTWAEDV